MKRNYGIDLLRLVSMFMVCVLHTIGQGGVLESCKEGTIEYAAYYLLGAACYCAVDVFALISGYVATQRRRDHSRLVNMWFQVFFYSIVLTLILSAFSIGKRPGMKEFAIDFFPVISKYYWYFTAYFALYFAMPVLNRFIFSADENTAKRTLTLIFVVYTVIGLIKDPFATDKGYSAIWLMVLYCAGGLAKQAKIFEKKKTFVLILMWLGCLLTMWAVNIFTNTGILLRYSSPTVLLSALLLLVVFSRLELKGTVIRKLSPLAFGIYLFQGNRIIWNYVLKDSAKFVTDMNIFVGLLCALGIAVIIFVSGLAAEYLRTLLFRLLKISKLSRKLAAAADKVIGKVSCVFN